MSIIWKLIVDFYFINQKIILKKIVKTGVIKSHEKLGKKNSDSQTEKIEFKGDKERALYRKLSNENERLINELKNLAQMMKQLKTVAEETKTVKKLNDDLKDQNEKLGKYTQTLEKEILEDKGKESYRFIFDSQINFEVFSNLKL